jgi:tetratricopeptide (TPR) repeat protein
VQKSLSSFSHTDPVRLLIALAEANDALGDARAGDKLWRRLAEQESDNLPVRLLLLDRAVEVENRQEATDRLEELRQIEGGEGPFSAYGEALVNLLGARPDDREAHERARGWLAKAQEARPGWWRVPLLEARLFDMEGSYEEALDRYQVALQKGAREMGVVRRVLQLLTEQRRYTEALTLLRKLPDQTRITQGLGRTAVELSLVNPPKEGDKRAAAATLRDLALAYKAVPPNSKDYRDHLWLGHVAVLVGQAKEAEKELLLARQLAEKAPETWVALILFYGAPRRWVG